MGKNFARPVNVPEFFISGIGSIEFMDGGIQRHMLVTERKVGGRLIYVPVVNIVLTTVNAHEAVMTVSRALASRVVGEERELVH